MADFEKAFIASSVAWGGFKSADPDTYCGIDRRLRPTWGGWPIIDAPKFAASDESELRSILQRNKRLKEEARELFRQIYCDRFCEEQIPNQGIGTELFQAALELGVARAWLQRLVVAREKRKPDAPKDLRIKD